MQHHMNQGERTLVKNALSVLDPSFRDDEDFAENPSRLAARTLYLRTLTKALRENDTQLLVMLTNKRHVEAVGRSFKGIDVEEPRIKELTEKLPMSADYPKYTDDAFNAAKKAKNDIHAAAKAFNVPAMSIAGAIVDEYSAQKVWYRVFGYLDWAQDALVKRGSSLEEVRENYAKGKDGPGVLKSNSSAKHDIGPGNFGVRTALELFEKYIIQDKGTNPIKSFLYKNNTSLAHATEQDKWEAYIENMVLTTEGTAWLAAAEIQKGKEALEKTGALIGLSEKEREAVLMTWYKQGQPYLDRYNDRPKNEIRPIGVGEGRGLFHYHDRFEEILK